MNKRLLQQQKAAIIGKAAALNAAAEAAGRDLTAEEAVQYEAYMAEARGYDARIQRAEELVAADVNVGVDVPDSARMSVTENIEQDPRRGFASAGEYFKAVRGAAEAAAAHSIAHTPEPAPAPSATG